MSEFSQESTDWTGETTDQCMWELGLNPIHGAIDEIKDFLNGYDVECIRALPVHVACKFTYLLSPYSLAVLPHPKLRWLLVLGVSDLEIESY